MHMTGRAQLMGTSTEDLAQKKMNEHIKTKSAYQRKYLSRTTLKCRRTASSLEEHLSFCICFDSLATDEAHAFVYLHFSWI